MAPARAPSAICMISHSRQLAGGTSDRELCRVGGLARPVEQVHVLLGPDVAVRSDRFRVAYRRVPSPPERSRIRVSASRRRRSCNRGSCRGVGHPSHRPTRTTIIRTDDPRCAPEPRAKSCSNKLQQSRRRIRSPHVGFRVEPADADAWRAPIRPFAIRCSADHLTLHRPSHTRRGDSTKVYRLVTRSNVQPPGCPQARKRGQTPFGSLF